MKKAKRTKMNLRMPMTMLVKIEEYAKKHGYTRSQAVRRFIAEALGL